MCLAEFVNLDCTVYLVGSGSFAVSARLDESVNLAVSVHFGDSASVADSVYVADSAYIDDSASFACCS